MTEHRDFLEHLNDNISVKEKLIHAHQAVKQRFAFIARIAVTIYDQETRVLKTYLHSSDNDEDPLSNYQALIDDAPSLKAILNQGRPRVVNNLVTFENGKHEHTQRIGRTGYAASYTLPMFYGGDFFGFLFFNSRETDVFDEKTLSDLDVFGHLISLMVINELSVTKVLSAAVRTTSSITHLRDQETGSHLDRMSRFSRIIARELAGKYELDDEYIEHVFMFAPLHDVGKIAIPDKILLKPAKLDADETEVMRTHARTGRQMIDDMLQNFGLENIDFLDVLRNIAEYHHEAVNGTGYPEGKKGSEIPLEARIVAVADVFDALTARRPYKKAWSNDEAIAMLKKLEGEKLDQDCVEALLLHLDEIVAIQQQFSDNLYG